MTLDINDNSLGVRLSNIQVMISDKLSSQPTLYVTDTRAGSMSWTHFVSCGKTSASTAFVDRTVTCTQVHKTYVTQYIILYVFPKVCVCRML